MNPRRRFNLNVAFFVLIAIAAVASGVNFLSLTEVVRYSMRTTRLERRLVEGYRDLAVRADFKRRLEPEVVQARQSALAAMSSKLADHVASTADHSIRAMICAAISCFAVVLSAVGIKYMADTTNTLRSLSFTDELTHLPNYRGLRDAAEAALDFALRTDIPLTLAIGDVRHFKTVNDSLGHETGNHTLVAIARILRATARGADIVARYGGDEFVVVMPGCGSLPDGFVRRVNEQLAQFAQSDPQLSQAGLTVTLTFGAAQYPNDGGLFTELVAAADERLYQARGDSSAAASVASA